MATVTPMRRKYRPVTIRFHADNADDEHPPPELLDPEIIEAVEKRDESRCLLCGSEELLVTHRVVSEHGKGVEPVYWLVGLGVVPQSYRSHEPSNIMTLCEPHAYAYDEAVWRFVPYEGLREEMRDAGRSILRRRFNSSLLQTVQGEMADAVRSPEVSYAKSGTPEQHMLFDLIIFCPQHMPKIAIPWIIGSPELAQVAIAATAFAREDCPRVLRAFRTLPLNPYVALAATFPIVGAAYLPLPDAAIRNVERGCDEIREAWNAATPKASADLTFMSPFGVD